ncbi:MAG: menaquinone biosynthesis protein [Spirochaetes bacterium]|nr:menaquinone biosynthesis protein [Spirochaetota bacterium]
MHIGIVPYLNVLPLVHDLPYAYTSHHPSDLAAKMHSGELDLSILPIAAVIENPGDYRIVPDTAIGCNGPVASVKILTRGDKRIKRLGLDRNSRTSNALAGVILRERYGIVPDTIPDSSLARFTDDASLDAQVLIGDDALFDDGPHLDLGAEWHALTGLPFVFAVWAVRADFTPPADLTARLTQAKRSGLATIESIIAAQRFADKGRMRRYFTDNMSYNLGERETAAMERFASYLGKPGLTFTFLPQD